MLKIDSLNRVEGLNGLEVFVQEEVIERNEYLNLLSSFPFDQMAREDVHKKVALNKYNSIEMTNFLSSNKPWKIFVDYINSKEFLNLAKTFLTHNSSSKEKFNIDNLRVGYEFSVLGDGSEVVPHKDKYGKLLSFVFYFVPENWHINNKYGGTQFYNPKNKMLNLKVFNDSSEFENMELAYEVFPRSNRLLVFKPSQSSWHGVNPIKTLDDFGRPAFIVTVHREEGLLEKFYNSISSITSQIQKFL